MKISGKPVRILSVSSKKKGTFKLHEESLAKILLDKDVQNKNVMVVAIVGPSRKGKSFLMNFLLRFMTARYINHDSDWLGDEESPLKGFVWSGGSDKVTVGVDMWSKPFIVKLSSNREVAVCFLDTQGTFDQESSLMEDTAIFALSTLCSSVLLYNLSGDILSIDLMHLELFVNYGLEALNYEKKTDLPSIKPFQKLIFIIRDYSFTNQYGEDEGKRHMSKRLSTSNKENKHIVSNIKKCFSDVNCYVLPSVGFQTSRSGSFDGKIQDIDRQFIEHIKLLAPSLLSPKDLVLKEIMGESITGKQLFMCFKSYLKIFNSGHLPKPKTIFEATIEINNLIATDKAKDTYTQLMEAQFGGEMPYSLPSRLESTHLKVKSIAIQKFRSLVKMGGEEHAKPYEQRLDLDLDRLMVSYRKYNSGKNIARLLRTPLIFFVISLVCYILSNLFSIFHQERLVKSCNIVMMLAMVTFVLMVYNRVSRMIGR